MPPKNKEYEWYEHDLMTWYDDLKYDEFVSDMNGYFENVQVINFDIIHHLCRGDKLQNLEKYYKN